VLDGVHVTASVRGAISVDELGGDGGAAVQAARLKAISATLVDTVHPV
jgi:hypothetical protein